MELTCLGSLAGKRNSTAANSPEVLLNWYRRGVKLNLPGSEGQRLNQNISKLHHSSLHLYRMQKMSPFSCSLVTYLAAYSRTLSCPSAQGLPRILWALFPHHIPGWSPCCCCGGLFPEDICPETKMSHLLHGNNCSAANQNRLSQLFLQGDQI